MLCDAHNHLQDPRLQPHHPAIFQALAAINLHAAVVNGTEENDWAEVAALARTHPWIRPSYGLHPWRAAGRSPRWLELLAARLDAEAALGRAHGVGEIGLDRCRRPHDFADQRHVFSLQLALAAERHLPVTIHCLDAWGALDEMLHRQAVPPQGFLLHAYAGPAEMIPRLAARGAYFSFNGHFLHHRLAARREAFQLIPMDRLLVETDAPSLLPPPAQLTHPLPPAADGSALNHPANLAATYPALAQLRGVTLPTLTAQILENFHRWFKLPPPPDPAQSHLRQQNQLPDSPLP